MSKKSKARKTDPLKMRIMPDEMSTKSICLECKYYDRKSGMCTAVNPFAKTGNNNFLVLPDKSSCYGFEKA